MQKRKLFLVFFHPRLPIPYALNRPRHPYTEALLSAAPLPDPRAAKRRITLQGDVPSPLHPPSGCVFHPRCRYKRDDCATTIPEYREIGPGQFVSCLYPL